MSSIDDKSIECSSAILRIKVNKNGDTIALQNTASFLIGFMTFADCLGILSEDVQKKLGSLPNDDRWEQLKVISLHDNDLYESIELLFGVGTCKKVWGEGEFEVTPDIPMVINFLNFLMPYISELAEGIKKKYNTFATEFSNIDNKVSKVQDNMEKTNVFNSFRQQMGKNINNM